MSRGFLQRAVLAALLCVTAAAASPAQDKAPDIDTRIRAAWQAASRTAQQGPNEVKLLDKAVLHLPAGYVFIPQAEAAAISRAYGNQGTSRLVGLVTTRSDDNWMIYIEYVGDGHVADAEAKDWNADELLQNIKDGTEAANEGRVREGYKALEVTGWIEKPAYDAASHRLVWSALAQEKDNPGAGGTANYNTYALGRDGHFELDLVAAADEVDKFKGDARTILASLDYLPGKRYDDFNASTDKLAAYGIAALVGGVAAKKLGILALIGVFFLKLGKLAFVAVAGALYAVKRMLFGNRAKPPAA